MISVSFTQFIDFTLKRDVSKVNMVRRIKTQGEYNPAQDFWRKLREEIKRIHQCQDDILELDRLLTEVADRKVNQYSQAIAQYKKFCRGKHIEWFDVGRSSWMYGRLFVRSTPEMGLIIDGQPYLIKMYFKEHKEKLDQRRAQALLTLMNDSLSSLELPNVKHAMLNIKKGRLIPLHKPVTESIRIALESEAESFTHIWDKVWVIAGIQDVPSHNSSIWLMLSSIKTLLTSGGAFILDSASSTAQTRDTLIKSQVLTVLSRLN